MIVKKSDKNEAWIFLCWIPLSNSSCKVLSMNFTAESHCCFSLTDQSSSAVSWMTLWEVQNRAVTYYTEIKTAAQFPTDTVRCFRFLFLEWLKTKLDWEQRRQSCHVTITCNRDWLRRLGNHHSRPQRPRCFWSAPRIATSGEVQHQKSAILGLPVTLRMLRVKSGKSD